MLKEPKRYLEKRVNRFLKDGFVLIFIGITVGSPYLTLYYVMVWIRGLKLSSLVADKTRAASVGTAHLR